MGRVESVDCEWSWQDTTVFTEVNLEVLDVFKGARRYPELYLYFRGGILGDTIVSVDSAASLQPQDLVLLYLAHREQDSYDFLNQRTGVIPVIKGSLSSYQIPIVQFQKLVDSVLVH
jgi:hypothetical protein